MGWPSCLLQNLQWVFCRDSFSRGLNSKGTLSGQLCSTRKELYGILWMDNSQQHTIQCLITLNCHWRCSKQWTGAVLPRLLIPPSGKTFDLLKYNCSVRPALAFHKRFRERRRRYTWRNRYKIMDPSGTQGQVAAKSQKDNKFMYQESRWSYGSRTGLAVSSSGIHRHQITWQNDGPGVCQLEEQV